MDKKISIRRNNHTNFWFFEDAIEAARFMLARSLCGYTLFINDREYPWVGMNRFTTNYTFTGTIEKHIKECIELDKAFYETS